MKKLLFRIKNDDSHRISFGEMNDLPRACFFRGKELGYEDIYIQWPRNVTFLTECPSNTILPIKFINRNDVVLSEYDVINLDEPNAFYDGSKPIWTSKTKDYSGHHNYLNKYYLETGERPIYDIPKDNVEDKYILFHLRLLEHSSYRNPNMKQYRHMVKIVRNNFGDRYKLYKCGERYRPLELKFDYSIPYFNDLSEFIRLVNNCSFFVCCNSGPNVIGYGLNVPLIEIEVPKWINKMGTQSEHHNDYWLKSGGTYGDIMREWADKSRTKHYYMEDPLIEEDIINFMNRFI